MRDKSFIEFVRALPAFCDFAISALEVEFVRECVCLGLCETRNHA